MVVAIFIGLIYEIINITSLEKKKKNFVPDLKLNKNISSHDLYSFIMAFTCTTLQKITKTLVETFVVHEILLCKYFN